MDKKKILVVDDDSFLLDMYALKFTQSGFDVTAALGALPALEKLRGGFTPDIMVTDIVMPMIDGFELLEKMKAEGLGKTTVTIILSNRGAESDIKRGQDLGASGYIVKASTTPAEVVTQVSDIVARKSA